MITTNHLICDGCGQTASPQHLAKRLQRLEWTTRYRPVHIGTLLLGAITPQSDADFLYSAAGFTGEASLLLRAAGIDPAGKTPEATLAEFQRGGFLLTHILECPLEPTAAGDPTIQQLLERQIPLVLTRLRRSLHPKRIALISNNLKNLTARLPQANLDCSLLLDDGAPFALDAASPDAPVQRLAIALRQTAHAAR
ncbi:MAG TPA: hypothetical protein VGI16_06635 [Candidatus Acidoferrum sp.]|jgi:hypothetical protein